MFCKVSAPLAFNKTVQTCFFLFLGILHLNARELYREVTNKIS